MVSVKIKTKGMHCSSCEILVKEVLEELEGVNKVRADYKSGFVEVDFDDFEIDLDKIKLTIKNEGYKTK